jgi:pimeloyl-ACP methyl ester carboxylesterase
VPVKGLSQPVEAFDLLGVGAARTRLQASTIRGLTPFVGRKDELAALDRARELAAAGQGQMVALIGDPGVGKSRMIYQLTRSGRMRPWLVLEGTSVSSGRASSWAPVADLLRSYFAIEPDEDRRRSAEKVLGKILMLEEALQPILSAVLALLDLPVEDAAWQALDPPRRRRRTLDGLKSLLVRESQRQPLALILEDLHWIDGETQALLDSLVESMPTCRMMLLVNYRPEYRHGWGSRAHYTQLRIDPLEVAGAEELLSALLGDAPDLLELKHRLHEASKGNPLFLEESVRILVDTGVLSGARGAYRLSRRPEQIEIPASVAAIIAARVDRLGVAEKTVLQLAAVIGEEVPLLLLEAVSDLSGDDLHGTLAGLRGRELLYEARLFPDIAYAFRHGLTRRVMYDGLLHETRRTLHARVAEALEARHADHLDEAVETLAHHFEHGAVWPQAVEYFLRAADRAKQRYTYPTALEFAQQARNITERDPALEPVRPRALELQGDLHSLMGELEAANQSYDGAIALQADAVARQRIESKRHQPVVAVNDGARIAYYLHGADAEALLFVNPVVYGLEVFQPIVERLCQEFRIITIDPRGTGASDPLQRPYGLSQHAEDVRAVIEQAGIGAITGIGISRGSNLLVRLAHMHPNLVRRLVLVGAPTDVGTSDSPAQRLDYLSTTASFLANEDFEGLMRYHIGRVFSEPDVADLAASRLTRWLGMAREAVLSFYDSDPDMDIRPLLPAIRVPTLIVHGTEDRQGAVRRGRVPGRAHPGRAALPLQGLRPRAPVHRDPGVLRRTPPLRPDGSGMIRQSRSEYPCWSSEFWEPGPAVAEESVGKDEELSHDRDERHFGRFPGGQQSLVLGLDRRIEADRDEGRQVEGLAQRSAAAADEALTAVLAGSPGHGREAGEACGGCVLEGAELGHLDQHGDRGGGADTGDAHQDLEAIPQGRVGSELRVQGGGDRGDLAVDLRQTRSGLTLEQGRAVRVAAVATGDPILDQGAAGAVHLLQRSEGSTDDGPQRRLEEGREAGEHRRVDGICFGMPADRFGEAPGLAGIDLDQRQAGRGQAALEGAVIGAAGLERDAGDDDAAEPGDQGGPSLGVMGEPADPAGGVAMNVERVFGDVHPDRLRSRAWHLFRVLGLSSGPSTPGYPFRPPGKERGDRTLARP